MDIVSLQQLPEAPGGRGGDGLKPCESTCADTCGWTCWLTLW